MLLAENILPALVETETLATAKAVEVVHSAWEAKLDLADETGESEGGMEQSLSLLAGIEKSPSAGREPNDGAA